MKDMTYKDLMHRYGKIFTVLGILIMFLAPTLLALISGVGPNFNQLVVGVIALSVLFLPGGIIEVLTYAPILGTSATYLAFITGNLANLKIPCVMNAKEIVGTEIGTPENEVVSTLAVAFSSITTIIIMAIGVILLIPLKPILNSVLLQPAFDWVISALFGALGYKYFKGNLKLIIAPIVLVVILSLIMPEFVNGQIVIIILISVVVSALFARILYVKKLI